MDNQTFAIQLQNLSKQYADKQVLEQVSIDVQKGECLLLVGHNGAGKTTLMKLMLGLTRPSSGSVKIMGLDPTDKQSIQQRTRIGFLPEIVTFQQALSGREVLHFYAKLNRSNLRQCDDLLDRVGLETAADQRVQTYSKGMRQRLGLAQALLGDPELLLLDEPTTGLDPTLRQKFYDIISDMQQQGTTSVICSHALNAFESRVDKVAIMNRGQLVAYGSLADLSEQVEFAVNMHIKVVPGQASELAEGISHGLALGSDIKIGHVNAQSIDLKCQSSDKMAIVRHLSGQTGRVLDVDIKSASLDDIYQYYMQASDEARL
jgi:Cu-processing system ATP-binding protein